MSTDAVQQANVEVKTRGPVGEWLYTLKMKAPWFVAAALFRVFYGFKVDGEEHFPSKGPFILAMNEYSLHAMLVSGWISIVMLEKVMETTPEAIQSFMMEELWSFAFFRDAGRESEGKIKPLMPQGAGRLALGLLDGVKALEAGGLVNINPEGDTCWDGRPLRPGKAAAWLALHTGAPIVPALASMGAYDIWPRWRRLPHWTGLLHLNIGEPFTLTDKPMDVVTPEDIAKANETIFRTFNKIRYRPGTEEDWAGPTLRNGEPVDGPFVLKPAHAPIAPFPEAELTPEKLTHRGVAQLLWRCPMCHTEESLLHKHRQFGRDKVRCRACGTRWSLWRVVHHDYRMKVEEGHPDMVGLELPLTTWYDKAREDFELKPIDVSGIELRPGEEVYLTTDGVEFKAYHPNPLFDGFTPGEAPRSVGRGLRTYGDFESLGVGQLFVTSERLVWQGPAGEIYLEWPRFAALNILMMDTLYALYGSQQYRFDLAGQTPLRWITYTGTLAKRAAEADGHELQCMRF